MTKNYASFLLATLLACAQAIGGPTITWHVDDDAPGDPGPYDPLVSDPLEDGSEAHPFDAIQEAIDGASDFDIVELAPGDYEGEGNGTITFKGKPITVRGASGSTWIYGYDAIYGYGYDENCVFRFENDESNSATLENVTIVAGRRAICCDHSSPTIRNVEMLDQQYIPIDSIMGGPQLVNVHISGAGFGGARFAGGTPTISSCMVGGNSGPGVHCLQGADCQIFDSRIGGNHTLIGGGLLVHDAQASIENSQISGNGAMEGGGIAAYYSNLTINGCQIEQNSGDVRGGGFLLYESSVAISKCRLIENYSYEFGGAIAADGGSVGISNSWFIENEAYEGGGAIAAENGQLYLINSLLRNNNNYAGDGQEAILVSGGGANIRGCTFAFNRGNAVRAVEGGHANVSSSILWDDYRETPMVEGEVNVTYSTILGGYLGTGNIAGDPKFALAQYDSLPLQPTSPCINRGNPSFNAVIGETDLLGGERVRHCRVDMGAYESDVMDDCNVNTVADACEIRDGTETDCNWNSLPDTCDLESPPVVLRDDFPGDHPPYELDPTNWPQHNLDPAYVSPLGVPIGFEEFIESRTFDLSWAQSVRLGYSYRSFDRSERLDIDYWTGAEWRLLRSEIGTGAQFAAARLVDIPRDGMHRLSKIRFRDAAMSPHGQAWYIDDVVVTRIEADCDGDGVIEVCAAASGLTEDCNSNLYPDACDFGITALGVRADHQVGQGPSDVAAADFDQDGDLDLLVSTRTWIVFGYEFAARLLLNDGWGGFTVMPYELPLGEPRRILAADLDGDGDMDAASSTHVLLNRGGIWAGFAAAAELPPPPFKDYDRTPQGVDAGDVDGDGDLDLLTTTGGFDEGGQLLVYLNGGQANFTFHSLAETGQGSRSVALADLDSDGDLDAAATIQTAFPGEGVLLLNRGQDEQGFWLGFGTPSLFRSSTVPVPYPYWQSTVQAFAVIATDLDRDGHQDLVVAHAYHEEPDLTSSVGVLLNRGTTDEDSQWLGFADPQEFPVGLSPFMLEAADMNADGYLDVVAAVADSGAVSILINRGVDAKGEWVGFEGPSLFPSGSRPTGLAAGDFNEDGAVDVAVANRATGNFFEPIGTPTAAVFLQLLSPDTDCNANGMPDECDLDDGLLTDCDGDGKADPCEPDCNGNGVVDHCDLTGGTSSDCNKNAIPDECDTGAAGSVPGGPMSDDCNGDGVPDECQSWHEFTAQSPFLFDIVDKMEQRFTLPDPPPANSPVRIDLTLEASLNTTNYYADIWINEISLGRLFGDLEFSSGRCPTAPNGGSPWTLAYSLDASTFNELLAAGYVTLRVTTTTPYDCYWNGMPYSSSYARFKVSYLTAGPQDCNATHSPDECDLAHGLSIDLSASGVPDECEGFGDADASHSVTLADWTAAHKCLHGPSGANPLPTGCAAMDFDLDGHTDLRDFSGFQIVFGFVMPD